MPLKSWFGVYKTKLPSKVAAPCEGWVKLILIGADVVYESLASTLIETETSSFVVAVS